MRYKATSYLYLLSFLGLIVSYYTIEKWGLIPAIIGIICATYLLGYELARS